MKILQRFDIPSGAMMGLYTLAMIGLSLYSVISGQKVDGSIPAMYAAAIAAFSANKTVKAVKGVSDEKQSG